MSDDSTPPDDVRDPSGTDFNTAYCISCGDALTPDADMCPSCGVSQSTLPETGASGRTEQEKYCTDCGTVINRDAELCPECGVRQTAGMDDDTPESDKDQMVAGLLAILLGGLGAHKFYLDNIGLGVLYLCFWWTFIPLILGVIEGIIYLTMSEEEFQHKYVQD